MLLNDEINLLIKTILLNLNEDESIFTFIWILNQFSIRSNDIFAMPVLGFWCGHLSIPCKLSLIDLKKALINCNEHILVFWAHACILWWTGEWSNDSIFYFIFFNAKLIVALGFAHTGLLVIGQGVVTTCAFRYLAVEEAPLSTRFLIAIITALIDIVIFSFDYQ